MINYKDNNNNNYELHIVTIRNLMIHLIQISLPSFLPDAPF